MNGLRTRPSPCSPESAPPNSSTRSATSLRDGFEFANAFFGLHIDDRPHVQAADRGVRVDAGRGSVPADDLQKPADEVAAAFPARPPCLRRRRSIWRLPSSPSKGPARLRAGSRCAPARQDRSRCDSDSRACARADLLRAPPGAAADLPFDPRKTRRTAWPPGSPSMNVLRMRSSAGVLARVIEDRLVHHLDRRGLVRAESPGRRPAIPADRANTITITALAFGSGTRRSFASSTMPSVPSEPTMIFARFTGFVGSTNSSRL